MSSDPKSPTPSVSAALRKLKPAIASNNSNAETSEQPCAHGLPVGCQTCGKKPALVSTVSCSEPCLPKPEPACPLPPTKRVRFEESCPSEVYAKPPEVCVSLPCLSVCHPPPDLGRGDAAEKMFHDPCPPKLPPPLCLPPKCEPEGLRKIGFLCKDACDANAWRSACEEFHPVCSYPKVENGKVPVCPQCRTMCLTVDPSCENTLRPVAKPSDCMYCSLAEDPRRTCILGYAKHPFRHRFGVPEDGCAPARKTCCTGTAKSKGGSSCCGIPWKKSDFEVPFPSPSLVVAPEPAVSMGAAPHHLLPEEALNEMDANEPFADRDDSDEDTAAEPNKAYEAEKAETNAASAEGASTVGPRGWRHGPGPGPWRGGWGGGSRWGNRNPGLGFGLGLGLGAGLGALGGTWYRSYPQSYRWDYDPNWDYYWDPYYQVWMRRRRPPYGYSYVGGKNETPASTSGPAIRGPDIPEKKQDALGDMAENSAPIGSGFSRGCGRGNYYVLKPRRIGSKHGLDCECCPACSDYPDVFSRPYLDHRMPCPWKAPNLWWYAGENLRRYKPLDPAVCVTGGLSSSACLSMPHPGRLGLVCGDRYAFVQCSAFDKETGIPCPYGCDPLVTCPTCKGTHYCSWAHSEHQAKRAIEAGAELGEETFQNLEWSKSVRYAYCPQSRMVSRLTWNF